MGKSINRGGNFLKTSDKSVSVVFAFAIASFAVPAQAQVQGDDLNASVTTVSGCTVSATDMNFGTPAPAATSVNATSTVTVRCSGPAFFWIEMDRGQYAAGTQRRMRGTNGDYVNYGIYRNAARTQVWGAGLLGNSRWGAILLGNTANYTAYGRIVTYNSAALAGSYQDTVTVTLNF